MAYAVVGGDLNAEPAIRLPGRKDLDTKTGTMTLQDARLLCDKRMVYAAIGGGLNAGSAIRLPGRKGSGYKIGHPDFAGCPIVMRQAHGLCCGLRRGER